MRATRLLVSGAAAAFVGLLLVVVEAGRALSGSELGGAAMVLLWLGLALVVLGTLALTAAAVVGEDDRPGSGPLLPNGSDGGQPADR